MIFDKWLQAITFFLGFVIIVFASGSIYFWIVTSRTQTALEQERLRLVAEHQLLVEEQIKLKAEYISVERERQRFQHQLQEVIEFYETRTDPNAVPPWMK